MIRRDEAVEREYSSAGLEHLPYKQRVLGSNPCTPTHKDICEQIADVFFLFRFPKVGNPFFQIGDLPFRAVISFS